MKIMEKAVYFAGPTGAGKSTASLVAAGCELIVDNRKRIVDVKTNKIA